MPRFEWEKVSGSKKRGCCDRQTVGEKEESEEKRMKTDLKIAGLLLLLCMFGGLFYIPHLYRDTYAVTVTEKVVKRYDKSDKYLIFTQTANGEEMVFENTDSVFEGKFNSSDIYGQLKVNRKYHIKVYGWRIPFFSAYQNIVSVKEDK